MHPLGNWNGIAVRAVVANTNVRGENVVEYLRDLKAALGGPMTILWDGSRVHDKSKTVQAFMARNPDVRTERIPAYVPDVNPDELVWSWTKYHRLCTLSVQNTAALRDLIAPS